jgi:hypothetical protein
VRRMTLWYGSRQVDDAMSGGQPTASKLKACRSRSRPVQLGANGSISRSQSTMRTGEAMACRGVTILQTGRHVANSSVH